MELNAQSERIAQLKLIDAVERGSVDQRADAEATLARMGEGIVNPLLEWIHTARPRDPEPYIRILAAVGQSAVERLLPYLSGDQRPEYWYACKALSAMGERRAIPPLLTHLAMTGDEYVRAWAAVALGDLGAVEAVEPLVQLLRDRDFGLRMAATDALTAIGESAADALLRVLNDREADPSWRRAACQVLGNLPENRVMKALMDRLNDRGEDRDIRVNAATGLRNRRRGEVKALLLEIGKDRSEPKQVRGAAINALRSWWQDSQDREVAAWATSVVNDGTELPSVRLEAIDVLVGPHGAYTPAFDAVAVIVTAIDGEEGITLEFEAKILRQAAIERLVHFGAGRAIGPLLAVLDGQLGDMAKTALKTLGNYGEMRALDHLRRMVEKSAMRFPLQTLSSYDHLRCWLAMPQASTEQTRETYLAEHGAVRVYRRDSIPVKRDPKRVRTEQGAERVSLFRQQKALGIEEEHCAVYLQRRGREYLIALLDMEPENWVQLYEVLQGEVREEVEARLELLEIQKRAQIQNHEDVMAIRYRLRRTRMRNSFIQHSLKQLAMYNSDE